MAYRRALALLRGIPPFASDQPVPYVLVASLFLVAAMFTVVYLAIVGLP